MTVAMNLATVHHHSFKKSDVMEVGVQVRSPLRFACGLTCVENSDNASDEPILVTEYAAPALVATCATRAPVIEHVAPASVVTHTALILVIEYVAPVPAHAHATPGQ